MSNDELESIVWKLFRYYDAAESIQSTSPNNPLIRDLANASEQLKGDLYWKTRGIDVVDASEFIAVFAHTVKERFPAFAEALSKEKPS